MPSPALATVRAASLEEALKIIKRDLGEEAVILSNRRLNEPGSANGQLLEFKVSRQPLQQKPAEVAESNRKCSTKLLFPQQSALDAFQDEVEKAAVLLRSLLLESRLLRSGDLLPAQVDVVRRLVETGVEPGWAEALVRSAPHDSKDPRQVLSAVANFLMEHIPGAEPLEQTAQRRRVLFIGPCGSGKTTTLAKVAAHCRRAGKRVGLITLDSYRAGAIEQLETYADCLRLELLVAENNRQLRRALQRLSDCQIVLMDSVGLPLKENGRHQHLQQLLQDVALDEVHLVLSALTPVEEMSWWRRCFSRWKPNRLIFTRLDDTRRYGNLLNGYLIFSLPVNYLSSGPQVPEDLQPASRESLLRLVLSAGGLTNKGGMA